MFYNSYNFLSVLSGLVYVASNSFVFVHCLRKDKIKEIFGCLFTQIAWVTRIKHGRLKGITFNGGSVEDVIAR